MMSTAQVISAASPVTEPITAAIPASSLATLADRSCRPSRATHSLTEGDLIIGAGNRSAIGTLVERTTRYCLLLHLPAGHDPATVAAAMTATVSTLPAMLRRSMTWDQGKEMTHHAAITL